jgi:cytochrome b subunit of formate dehydrogenase
MSERIFKEKGLVVRHSVIELIEHWTIALSGLTLLLTGFFQMPTANRYYFTSLPGLSWSGDFFVSLNVHYAASILFVAAALFHLVYHGMRGDKGMIPQKGDIRTSVAVIKSFFGKGEEPPFNKYLPEQRLAYIGMAFIIAMLILSGLVKTYKNIYAPDMSLAVVLTATWIHNIFFILFMLAFLGHMAAIVLKPNRPMVRGILTGAVRLDYALHRHPLWIEGMKETVPEEQVPEEWVPLTEPPPVAGQAEVDQSDEIGNEIVNEENAKETERRQSKP